MFNRHQSNHFLRHKLSISLQSIKLIFKFHDNFVVLTKDCHVYKLCHKVDEKKTITMKDIKFAVRAPELTESVQWLLLSHFKPNIQINIIKPRAGESGSVAAALRVNIRHVKIRYFLSKIVNIRAKGRQNGCKCAESRLHTFSHSANKQYTATYAKSNQAKYSKYNARNANS